LLTILDDGKLHTLDEYRKSLKEKFNLTEPDVEEKQISSKGIPTSKTKFQNRTADDVSKLKSKKHLEHSDTAIFRITELGLNHLYYLRAVGEC
tara:strand:+ start:198 stop:476 length:279 start_codon:yes stop_codon:yes gene_type:complete